jgi:hypothetical protein
MAAPTYASLLAIGPWRPIPHCPGRRVWPGPTDSSPSDLVGSDVPVQVFRVDAARDPVHVAVLDGGGLISYGEPDGRFVHTLNTPDGFARKLEQLGIRVDDENDGGGSARAGDRSGR